MYRYSYSFGNFPICSDIEHNISIHVFTDIPIWNFRVYDNINIWDSTKMIRVMMTEPTIIDLREPWKSVWDLNTIDLVFLDKLIGEHWDEIIAGYNNEVDDEKLIIPENLKKPDYTKLRNSTFRESLYVVNY